MHPRWVLVLIAGLLLVLASCTSNVKQSGSLEIKVQGIGEASVEVTTAAGKVVFSGKVAGSKLLADLEPGTYKVDGGQVKGYRDPEFKSVDLSGGQKVEVILIYQQAPTPSATVARLEITAVRDALDMDLPFNRERNANKEVNLYASQTEEAVCVTVRATDATGAAVVNAPIVVNVAELFGDHVAIIRGCAKGQIGASGFRDGIYTGADGTAVFTLYATHGGSPNSGQDLLLLLGQPAKVVVAAENTDNTAILEEFKVFFYNISHLYFNRQATKQRVGSRFAEENILKPEDDRIDRNIPRENAFPIVAGLFTKQPQTAIRLPDPLLNFEFEVLEGADKVHFANCNNLVTSKLCRDPDGDAYLEPNANLGLKDMPISATVKVTLYVQYQYGDTVYRWPLKDFTVTKTWIGTYLTITKNVDHHVLTWAGPEHHLNVFPDGRPKNRLDYTLDAANDPAVAPGSVFTATYTITVTNAGTSPAHNVTMADALPAELGVITSTANPAGATYDSTNHVVTWNWQNSPDPRFDVLAPGESITATIQVYVRQKPGFCWDDTPALGNDLKKAQTYQIKPLVNVGRSKCGDTVDQGYSDPNGTRYDDPYRMIDGYFQQDVTSTWYTGAPLGKGGFQVKVDFNGAVNEKDVVIWAVRPRFVVTKTLVDPSIDGKDVGRTAYYDISIRNDPRDVGNQRYAFLRAAYPAEFDGSGRDNPYGRNVLLTDVMDVGLDFISSGPLTIKDDDGVNADTNYASNWVPDKGITWNHILLMGGGDSGKTQIALRTDLPGSWYNCAFLDADNLNQPFWEAYPRGVDWAQYEFRPWRASPLHGKILPNLRYGIRDCVALRVIKPTQPWVHLDSDSEFVNDNPANNPADREFAVVNGETFFYHWTVTNTGSSQANGVTFKVNLTGTAAFSSNIFDHKVYVSSNGGATWAALTVAATASGNSVTFGPIDLPAGYKLRFTSRTTATGVGDADAVGTVTYTNPEDQTPLLPMQTSEDTAIQP